MVEETAALAVRLVRVLVASGKAAAAVVLVAIVAMAVKVGSRSSLGRGVVAVLAAVVLVDASILTLLYLVVMAEVQVLLSLVLMVLVAQCHRAMVAQGVADLDYCMVLAGMVVEGNKVLSEVLALSVLSGVIIAPIRMILHRGLV